MTGVSYWLVFGFTALLLLVIVPWAGRREFRRSARTQARERAYRERLALTEQARRRIRLKV